MEIKIKDFIINGDIPQKETTTTTRTPTEYEYKLEYENDTDFIISRKTQKTDKLLVVLISQGQIYITNRDRSNTIAVNSAEQVKNFMKH